MKRIYFLLLFSISAIVANAQTPDDFVMTFEVDNTVGLDIKVPVYGVGGNSWTVSFGDGTVITLQESNGSPVATHTYSTAGVYTVIASGDFRGIQFSVVPVSYASKLKTVEQWGTNQWVDMYQTFWKCSNLTINAVDTPDLSQTTTMREMFAWASSVNSPLNHWDVSNVADMVRMFHGASSFNQPLDNWDVSNVINIGNMFLAAYSFNQDLSSWNFNAATDFSGFVRHTDVDVNNYDALLLKFAQLGLQVKTLQADSMQYCNAAVRDYLINTLNWTISGDAMSTVCPDNVISGEFVYDENMNGCDANDLPLYLAYLRATDGTMSSAAFPDNQGQYALSVYPGSYTVEAVNMPGYFTVTPASSNVTFAGSGGSQTLDFCITANQTIKDLNITILPSGHSPRPGFDSDYQLIVKNIGTQTLANAAITLTFDDTKQTFVSANPNVSASTANQLNFNIANLQPLSSSVIDFTMNTIAPPTVNGGDILNFVATVMPSTNDNTPNDNTFTLNQTVVNAYDPNDKQVLQGDTIDISEVDEYLHYLIRFQNTGTASAINVKLKDVLDSTVDWSTLQMINASDNYRTEITDGNKLEFIFDNINLPHEAADTAGSHGFIAYKVKPRANTQVGDIIIGNEVRIYFDYNLPIITNAVSTEVTEETPPTIGLNELDLNKSITVYPNPAEKEIYIRPGRNIALESATIYSMDGRVLFTQADNLGTIQIGQLNQGIYIIRITTNLGTVNKKIIKVL